MAASKLSVARTMSLADSSGVSMRLACMTSSSRMLRSIVSLHSAGGNPTAVDSRTEPQQRVHWDAGPVQGLTRSAPAGEWRTAPQSAHARAGRGREMSCRRARQNGTVVFHIRLTDTPISSMPAGQDGRGTTEGADSVGLELGRVSVHSIQWIAGSPRASPRRRKAIRQERGMMARWQLGHNLQRGREKCGLERKCWVPDGQRNVMASPKRQQS
jgi:hypothetical protein